MQVVRADEPGADVAELFVGYHCGLGLGRGFLAVVVAGCVGEGGEEGEGEEEEEEWREDVYCWDVEWCMCVWERESQIGVLRKMNS